MALADAYISTLCFGAKISAQKSLQRGSTPTHPAKVCTITLQWDGLEALFKMHYVHWGVGCWQEHNMQILDHCSACFRMLFMQALQHQKQRNDKSA